MQPWYSTRHFESRQRLMTIHSASPVTTVGWLIGVLRHGNAERIGQFKPFCQGGEPALPVKDNRQDAIYTKAVYTNAIDLLGVRFESSRRVTRFEASVKLWVREVGSPDNQSIFKVSKVTSQVRVDSGESNALVATGPNFGILVPLRALSLSAQHHLLFFTKKWQHWILCR